jgi:hypothetical protein
MRIIAFEKRILGEIVLSCGCFKTPLGQQQAPSPKTWSRERYHEYSLGSCPPGPTMVPVPGFFLGSGLHLGQPEVSSRCQDSDRTGGELNLCEVQALTKQTDLAD